MWFDLSAADTGKAGEFNSSLFGWMVAPARDARSYEGWTAGPAGTSVTIADPGGAHLALFKPHAQPG
jgi:hypothetical protein